MDSTTKRIDSTLSLPDRVVEYITNRKHVSFVELQREFPEAKGEHCMNSKMASTIVYWEGLSPTFIDVLIDLLDQERIHACPCDPIVYWADGQVPNLPVLKRAYLYKTRHWLPIVFNPGKRSAEDKAAAARGGKRFERREK